MIVGYRDPNDKDTYLKGGVIFYLDHDIPIKSPAQFLKEFERRVRPDEITIVQQIKRSKVKFADKWIKSGWRLFCYDDYKTSFTYDLDIRFERLDNGHFRKWFIFMNKKTLCLYFDKAFDFAPCKSWGEFLELSRSPNEQFEKKMDGLLKEVKKYIIPIFHSTKIIAASDKFESKYRFLDKHLKAGYSLDYSVWEFFKYYALPVWQINFICSERDRLEISWNTLFYNLHQDIMYILDEMGIGIFFADPFYTDASFYFDDKSDIEAFNSIINERFDLNLPLDSRYLFWQIEVAIVVKNILRSLKDKPLPETIDYSLFSDCLENPKAELKETLLAIISSENITYLGEPVGQKHAPESYVEFQSKDRKNGYKIVLYIKGTELGGEYEIVNVYAIKESGRK